MARPTKRETRERQLNLKLTTREHAWLARRAEAVRMRMVEYARWQLLIDRPSRRDGEGSQTQITPLLVAQLSRIGNNLNQIARRLHQFDSVALAALQPVLDEVRAFIKKVSGDGA